MQKKGRRLAIQAEIKKLEHLYNVAAARERATVSVACADDAHVLQAVGEAYARRIANFILVGDAAKIREQAQACHVDIAAFEVVHEAEAAATCRKAVSFVTSGRAQAVMKGLVDTSVIMKAVLDKENGMRTGQKLSHVAAFEMPAYHKLLFVTDAAINIAPDIETKKAIIQNAVAAVTSLGIKNPKVALLAAKEKTDPKMPVTMEAAAIADMYQNGKISGCILDGPLALDNAVSIESAALKGISSPVVGDADILVCPNIESGNILYKSLAFLGGGQNGGVVVGAARPVILTSRADSAQSKLISIALGVLF